MRESILEVVRRKGVKKAIFFSIHFCNNRVFKYIDKIRNTLKRIQSGEKTLLFYWWTQEGVTNWGDELNPILIERISGRKPILVQNVINYKNEEVYSVIGSVLGNNSSKNLIVWGSGFISSSSQFKKIPHKICAVRGPLTRELIMKHGVHCPEIYGDPALLYPLFYKPDVTKKYKLGIIPHYIDKNNHLLKLFKYNPDILIIDVENEINKMVDAICSCELIASSSLHGMIASDAYGIPSIWIEFSNKIVGDKFKFYDYFLSVGRINEKPLIVKDNTSLQDIYRHHINYKIYIDLAKLLNACPFLERTKREELIEKIDYEFHTNTLFIQT